MLLGCIGIIDMKINKNIGYRIIDGEMFIVTPFNKTLHNLNETGTFIFQQIEKKKSQDEIIDRICEEFEVEREIAKKDVEDFIEKLKKKQILKDDNHSET